MLIQDCFLLKNYKIISESSRSGEMKIRGIFQKADEKNNNGRVYPKALLEREIKRLQPLIQENRLLGELDHPAYENVKLSNASHLITNLSMNKNDVIGEAKILSTPAGLVIQSLLKDGVQVGISSRGLGTLSENKDHKIVNEDYKMITFDMVADPSTKGAFPGLTESTQIKEKIVESYEQIMKEKIFVCLLRDKLFEKFEQ